MSDVDTPDQTEFCNPVYGHSFPDPFILKFGGEYFAYCTGFSTDGNVFPVLHSVDLVNWREIGAAMRPLDPSPPLYWAPEVTYDNGRFYLYYSTGNEVLMELRVGVSDDPSRGFVDQGVKLTREDFAIDPHVFTDDDGQSYLFYATDFLDHSHIGTGTVVDKMLDWFTLEGKPRPVTRARYEWQIYDPARKEKGGVRWYTVEGPSALKWKGRYFEMFSGGNWQNETYGMSFAATEDIGSSEEWEQYSDGEKILPVLRTIPGRVVGPGHNSLVRGPNNRELFCVYHYWSEGHRVMAIDRLDLAGDRIFVAGPTYDPQPFPFSSKGPELVPNGSSDNWDRLGSELINRELAWAELEMVPPGAYFLMECGVRFIDVLPEARAGFRLSTSESSHEVTIHPEKRALVLSIDGKECGVTKLSSYYDSNVSHLMRIESGPSALTASFGGPGNAVKLALPGETARVSIFAQQCRCVFDALEFTGGFEERFENDGPLGVYKIRNGTADCSSGVCRLQSLCGQHAEIAFRQPFTQFEIAVNLSPAGVGPTGIRLYGNGIVLVAQIYLDRDKRTLAFESDEILSEANVDGERFEVSFLQLRVIYRNGVARAYVDGDLTASFEVQWDISDAAVFSAGSVDLDMIRLTGL